MKTSLFIIIKIIIIIISNLNNIVEIVRPQTLVRNLNFILHSKLKKEKEISFSSTETIVYHYY